MTESAREQLRVADWPRDAAALQALRCEVFIDEQGVPREIEWDGRDATARHVLLERDGETIGCGRLLPDGRIGRLAVRAALRGGGRGRRLLDHLLQLARASAMPRVYLHAQASAEDFYARAGFLPDGELFEEAGIAHRNMTLELDYRDWDQPLIGVASPQPFAQLVLAQLRLARREAHILSPDLDPAVFDNPELASAITALLRRAGRRGRLRILVRDLRPLVECRHVLLPLARRLPTGIALRSLPEHPDWQGDSYVVRDRDSLLRRPGGSRAVGSYRPGDRGRAEQALGHFDELWRVAREDPELRRMAL